MSAAAVAYLTSPSEDRKSFTLCSLPWKPWLGLGSFVRRHSRDCWAVTLSPHCRGTYSCSKLARATDSLLIDSALDGRPLVAFVSFAHNNKKKQQQQEYQR